MSDPQLVQLAVVEQAPAIPAPPTQDELPYDDGIPMESPRHKRQMELLTKKLHERWHNCPNCGCSKDYSRVFLNLKVKGR